SQCPHVNFTIDSTVSIFNVLYIPEFYNYLIKNGLIKPGRMSLYLLFDPNYFSIRNLPQKAKKQIELVYNNFIQQLASSPETANICQHARSVIKHMFGEDYQLQNEFETEIKKVDELRGENFKEVFSEITQLLN
ncbi:MAG TPA: hypothetical protein VG603_12145, partial [Chitinophagales bacterium]|nr:hypothetical protein [Chitinophagales bacterium]